MWQKTAIIISTNTRTSDLTNGPAFVVSSWVRPDSVKSLETYSNLFYHDIWSGNTERGEQPTYVTSLDFLDSNL